MRPGTLWKAGATCVKPARIWLALMVVGTANRVMTMICAIEFMFEFEFYEEGLVLMLARFGFVSPKRTRHSGIEVVGCKWAKRPSRQRFPVSVARSIKVA